ncbi:MAG: carbohydrate kinase [Eubacterium aggregans]|uniref:Fructokinase n=1 Tax=Eubacterium aggregans TaxID=81409 RepID=A0A1H3WWT8_9FIRM|nr:carbohydrate kinase [Eubacterium aggregans]MDD4691848.1 carbohydrate kinase [Eubacterium aggregans]MEA5074645.1 carbohydrate kinase [Eubacterium aggregans]SDZ91603.1 fructokinase [Eubacterium aggregans]
MYDISAIGEVLIDFTPMETEAGMGPSFSANPGGAPANVLVQGARLGSKTAFLGKVGQDAFGHFLKQNLEDNGVDCQGLVMTETAPTTLAFVHLDDRGDRSFSFYRRQCADTLLTKGEIAMSVIKNSRVFHFGSVSLTDEPTRSTTLTAVALARYSGAMISYDPNYRPLLWANEQQAVKAMRDGLAYADILKVSEEEARLLTGEADLERAAAALYEAGPTLVCVTLGHQGAYFFNGSAKGYVPAFSLAAVDTTGAGDAFFGALLHQLSPMCVEDLPYLKEKELMAFFRRANAAGGLTTTGYGAIPSMPGPEAIEALCRKKTTSCPR